ncbi:MAG: adenylate/guanylate cyclase domain-containing protein [Labilithrix sp.]
MDEDALRGSFPPGMLAEVPRFDRVFATFADPTIERGYQRETFENTVRRYVRYSIPLATIAYLSYGVHDYFVLPGVYRTALFIRYAFFAPLALLIIYFVQRNRRYLRHQPLMLAFGMVVNADVMAIGAVAHHDAGYYIYNGYAIIFVTLGPFLARMNVKTQAVYTGATIAVFLVLDALVAHADLTHRLSFVASFVTLGLIGALSARQLEFRDRLAFLQRRVIREQLAALEVERHRSESLLLNVLPRKIAERLKEQPETIIADRFDHVTVLFSDIVGFTEMSARLDAEAIVKRLDEVFSSFDEIADSLGLEKIKTIGDAYMVCGGIPSPKKDHVEAVCEMALRMRDKLAELSERSPEPLRIRIGVHTGPVVAGVIGKKKFIYDVWGDTVNAASRMESHGVPGQIQVSQAIYDVTKHLYDYESRGTITVKGKGEMATYLLLARREVSEGRIASLPAQKSAPDVSSSEEE